MDINWEKFPLIARHEMPKTWDEAIAGDLIGDPSTGQFRVIARKLPQKWRAEKLFVAIPDAQIWLDTPRAWASNSIDLSITIL